MLDVLLRWLIDYCSYSLICNIVVFIALIVVLVITCACGLSFICGA